MRALKLTSLIIATAAVLALAAGSTLAAAPAASAAPAAATPPGCYVIRTPFGYRTVCGNGSGMPGGPGSGGGGGGGGLRTHWGCQLDPLNGAVPPYPAPKGQIWMRLVCSSILNPGMPGGLVLVPVGAKTGNPGITPQELLQWALADLNVPVPAVHTAPPAGRDGLVGLPEWFWISHRQFRPIEVRVAVGPVFADVTATPGDLTISPGGGLPSVTCPGSGTRYNPGLPASDQHTSCSYTYQQSSALQPSGVYTASVTVTWTATWVGSGGAGGAVNPPLVEHATVTVPVAEGQALVGSP